MTQGNVTRTRRLARVVFRIVTVLVSFMISLAAAELVLRSVLPPFPRVQKIVDDPALGWDSDPPLTSLENTGSRQTVYFLGDSFTQGRTWPLLTQRYAAERGILFDGHVLGVSGYGTTQSLLKLQRDYDRYRPQLVLLLFFAWNDLRDDVAAPAIFYSPTTRTRPYLLPGASGFELRPAAPLSVGARILYHTDISRRFLLKALLRVGDRLARTDVDAVARWHVPVAVNYTERATWEPFYLPEREGEYVRHAYAATEEAFRRMRDFLWARGSQLAVIGIDNPFVVDPDVADRWIRPTLNFDRDQPLRRIGNILAAQGIPFKSATAALRAERVRLAKKMYNPPDGELSGHLEPEGEGVVAKIATEMATGVLSRANRPGS